MKAQVCRFEKQCVNWEEEKVKLTDELRVAQYAVEMHAMQGKDFEEHAEAVSAKFEKLQSAYNELEMQLAHLSGKRLQSCDDSILKVGWSHLCVAS